MPSERYLAFDSPVGARGWEGPEVHGLWFTLLASIDPALARHLHADGAAKRVFTLSPVVRSHVYPADDRFLVRATVLDDEMGAWLWPEIERLARCGWEGKLGGAAAGLVGLAAPADGAGGDLTYEDLLIQGQRDAAESRGFILDFLTPTALRLAGTNLPLPEPQGLFTGYLAKWNAFSPLPFLEEMMMGILANGGVVIARHAIRSEVARLGRVVQVGFTGRVSFQVNRGLPRAVAGAIYSLARFAVYAGSGYKTTMGMGRTEHRLSGRQNG